MSPKGLRFLLSAQQLDFYGQDLLRQCFYHLATSTFNFTYFISNIKEAFFAQCLGLEGSDLPHHFDMPTFTSSMFNLWDRAWARASKAQLLRSSIRNEVCIELQVKKRGNELKHLLWLTRKRSRAIYVELRSDSSRRALRSVSNTKFCTRPRATEPKGSCRRDILDHWMVSRANAGRSGVGKDESSMSITELFPLVWVKPEKSLAPSWADESPIPKYFSGSKEAMVFSS